MTGSALTYKDAWWRLVYPELREVPAEGTLAQDAAAFEAAHARFGDALRSVKLPEPGVPAYHVYLTDGEALLSIEGAELIDRWRPGERTMGFLFDLHAHLLAGERGEKVGGAVALLGAFLVMSGALLWWPARRRFRVSSLLTARFSRRTLLPSHRDLGMLASPVLLVLCVTGGGIVFYGATGAILNGVLPGGDPVSEAGPEVASEGPVGLAGESLLTSAERAFPDARLVFYYPPAGGSGVHGFRLKRPCEVHPNGRSYLYLDPEGEVLRRVDACAQPPGQRALYAVYPLHAGKTGGPVYEALVFLGGLVLALISATGALSYIAKLRRV